MRRAQVISLLLFSILASPLSAQANGISEQLPVNIPGYTYNTPSIPSIMPDKCIPTPFGTYCITFTNSSTGTLNSILQSQNQIGQMQQQQLQQAPLGSIASLATDAGIQAQIQQLQKVVAPTMIANAIAGTLLQNQGQENSTIQALLKTMQTHGTGQVASTQIESAILANVAAQINQQNVLHAAEQQQEQANIQQADKMFDDILDINSPPDKGWLI